MLDGDPARVRMAYSLLFCLPGTPVLFYGEEIGMGENLEVAGRHSVRSPMQWSDEPGAGFSPAPEEAFAAPLVAGGYGPETVNVAAQRRDPDSLLNWFERLIRRRRETPEFALGTCRVVKTAETAVFAHRFDWDGSTVVAVHNLGTERLVARVDLDGCEDCVVADDLLEGHRQDLDGTGLDVSLDRYGYRWLRLVREGQRATP
jgi:glycosidase